MLIALEEAFSIPGLTERQPVPDLPPTIRPDLAADWTRRLADVEELRLADMDESGVDVQVLSLTQPGIQIDLDPEVATANARFANDYLADAVARHPDRFAGFAALALQDPAGAASELRRAVTELGFRGALVNDGPSARYLDEPRFAPLWEALEELRVPLYLHPGFPPADRWAVLEGHPEMSGAFWSWGAETGAHALRIVTSGVFDRHPGARLILGHMGEFLPFQRWRFDSRWATLRVSEGGTEGSLERPPSAYLGTNVVFTMSGVFDPVVIEAAVREVGADAVLFSIDYPYERSAPAVDALARTALSSEDREKVESGNARRLLGIPAS